MKKPDSTMQIVVGIIVFLVLVGPLYQHISYVFKIALALAVAAVIIVVVYAMVAPDKGR